MGVIQIITDEPGQIYFPNVRRVRIISSDSLVAVTTAGYLNPQTLQGFVIYNTDIIDMWYGATASVGQQITSPGTYAEFIPSISNGVITLVATGASMVGPSVITSSSSSATPGTLRAFTGQFNETATVMTSGNVVGVRGVVNMVGASGGFIYGTQGKVIATGTLSGSSWTIGLFGQLDISAATVNAGQMAPIWGDYGATSGTLTDRTGMYGIAMTNTTAAVLASQIYLFGGADALFKLEDNNGGVGATYFVAAGAGATSWGAVAYAPADFVLTITVNGTAYYLPLKASNA